MEVVFGIICFLIILIYLVAIAAENGSAIYHVNIKGGAPYCPRCNRQVSYRRNNCRCCGYVFVTYGEKPEGAWAKAERLHNEALRAAAQEAEEKRLIEVSRKEEEERIALRDRRRIERREALLAQGITPGPLAWVELFSVKLIAWYKNASDLMHMFVLALCFSIPSGLIAFMIFKSR